jgi:hypothetical protein
MPRTRRLDKHLAPIGLIALAAAGASAYGCSGTDGQTGECVSELQFFAENVWGPIMSQKCIACHNPTGLAKDSKMVLHGSSEAGFLNTNLEIVKSVASFERDGVSLLLLKPTLTIPHTGGEQIKKGSSEFASMELLVQRFKHADTCEPNTQAFFAGVNLASPTETLRKASLALAGRLPTEDESKAVSEKGMDAIDPILEAMMTEPTFYDRLKEIYNDLFLTDRYARGDDGLNLLDDGLADGTDGYNPKWWESCDADGNCGFDWSKVPADAAAKYGTYDVEGFVAGQTNTAVAREPLELIAHVVQNNRPFTEILTANYIMLNPFSAKAYQADVKFENEYNPYEWQEGNLGYIPHAGVLTSPMFLVRHPTTATNRNRHRARMIYQWFLGTDILKTAERPIDPTKISDFNPTRENPACTVCHAQIDPVAGALHSFGGAQGEDSVKYFPKDTWITEMTPPGFGTQQIPYDQFSTSVQWLGQAVANDPRFALAAVYTMYTGLTGHKPLLAPTDVNAPEYRPTYKAYLAEYQVFEKLAQNFVKSGYNLKQVVKDIVKSPYFRAKNAIGVSGDRALELADIGTGRLLIPEQLNRKILAVLGYPWTYDFNRGGVLLDEEWYRILYGGINSDDVMNRMTEPNGVMANIADRMANEMSCIAVPRDFHKPADQRLLFKIIEPTFEPEDANHFAIDSAEKSIKEQIVQLHEHILGEQLDVNDPEIQRSYTLFLETWREGKARMALPDGDPNRLGGELAWNCQVKRDFYNTNQASPDYPEDQQLVRDDNFTIRAWMAVVSYLVTDYAFIYE